MMKKWMSCLLAAVLLILPMGALADYNDHTDYVDWPLVPEGEEMTVRVATVRSEQYGNCLLYTSPGSEARPEDWLSIIERFSSGHFKITGVVRIHARKFAGKFCRRRKRFEGTGVPERLAPIQMNEPPEGVDAEGVAHFTCAQMKDSGIFHVLNFHRCILLIVVLARPCKSGTDRRALPRVNRANRA